MEYGGLYFDHIFWSIEENLYGVELGATFGAERTEEGYDVIVLSIYIWHLIINLGWKW